MTPLVDLHRHLEGSIRLATCIELAARVGIIRSDAQWRSALVAAERGEGLRGRPHRDHRARRGA
jgi:adenosine deaminase